MDTATLAPYARQVLEEATLPDLPNHYRGKVRDNYDLPDGRRILITSDRISAFDISLAAIPFKGRVLTQTARFWFERTGDICPNHVLAYPDPNVVVGRRLSILPVEIVVRGYLAGTTSTSILTRYKAGEREMYGHHLPDGMRPNQKLDHPIITHTTKAGLILADTKYEFGLDGDGRVVLADEIHTPDSSRYWFAQSYPERFAAGASPESFDKDFVRNWVVARCDPYKDPIPAIPADVILETAAVYIRAYETITGEPFTLPDPAEVPLDRIRRNIAAYLAGGA